MNVNMPPQWRTARGGVGVRARIGGLILLLLGLLTLGAAAEARLCVSTETCAALLAEDGREIVAPGRFDDVYCLVDGARYALGTRTDAGMRYALADADGALLTAADYEMLAADGDAIIFRQAGGYGAMTLDGEPLLPAAYTQLVSAGEGAFLALTTPVNDDTADQIVSIAAGGEETPTGVRTAIGLEPLSDGRMPFLDPGTELYGYVDAQGQIAIPAQFSHAGAFEDGAARAALDGKFGLIDPSGAWRIAPEYDFLERGDGIVVALRGSTACSLFDEATFSERFRFESAGLRAAAVGSFAAIVDDGALRVYTVDGTLLLETSPSATLTAGAGDQLILADGEWGAACAAVVQPDGTMLERRDQHLLALSDDRYAFAEMRAAAYYSDALETIRYSCDYESLRFGMMDASGREILPAEFLEIYAVGQDRYLTVAEDGLRLIDADGETLWTCLQQVNTSGENETAAAPSTNPVGTGS